jgi:hypothetical protein
MEIGHGLMPLIMPAPVLVQGRVAQHC